MSATWTIVQSADQEYTSTEFCLSGGPIQFKHSGDTGFPFDAMLDLVGVLSGPGRENLVRNLLLHDEI